MQRYRLFQGELQKLVAGCWVPEKPRFDLAVFNNYHKEANPLTTATTRTAKSSTKLDALRRKINTNWEVLS
jgi:hypothetical protein